MDAQYGFQEYGYGNAWEHHFASGWEPGAETQWSDAAFLYAAQLEAWNATAAFSVDTSATPWDGYLPEATIQTRPPPGIPTPWDDEAAMEASIEYFRRAFDATGIAIDKIEEVCKGLGPNRRVEPLHSAMEFLQGSIETRDAARAYHQVLHAATIGAVPHATVQPVKAAIRDVAVLRCAAEADPANKEVYEHRLGEAFGILLGLETDLWSQLKLAYRKQLNFYMSNNQIETAKRGARRPDRRRRQVSAVVQEAAEHSAKAKALQGQLQEARRNAEESKTEKDRAKVQELEEALEAAEALQRKALENMKTSKVDAASTATGSNEANSSSSSQSSAAEEDAKAAMSPAVPTPASRKVRSPRLTAGDPVYIEYNM